MSFLFYNLDNLINVLLTDLVTFSLYHDSDNRLCSGFSDKNTSCITKSLCYFAYCLLNIRIVLCIRLTLYPYVLKNLRIEYNGSRKLA